MYQVRQLNKSTTLSLGFGMKRFRPSSTGTVALSLGVATGVKVVGPNLLKTPAFQLRGLQNRFHGAFGVFDIYVHRSKVLKAAGATLQAHAADDVRAT